MHVALKWLSTRNVVDHTEWKTTDLWLGVAKPIPSPSLLERLTAASAPCPHTFKCLNCKSEHFADDTKCSFWRHRFDKQWHSNKAAELCTGCASNSNIQRLRVGNF